MPRSVPDDELMDNQQAQDLGHATKSQPEQAQAAEDITSSERIESDMRANRGLGTLLGPGKKSETQKALERAAYRPERRRQQR